MVTEDQVLDALRQVIDPEIGLNIVDLGLVYSARVHDGHVRVQLTMTTQACPLHTYLTESAESAIREQIPDANSVAIEMVWEPPWNPAMMSSAAKRQLGWGN